MKNPKKYKYYVTLFATVLGLGLVNLTQVEATETTQTSDTQTVPDLIVDPLTRLQESEKSVVKSGQLRSGWDIDSYTRLQDASFFLDVDKIPEPIDNKYAFNLSRTSRTTFKDGNANVIVNPSSATYVQLSAMNIGDNFYITNCGYYKGRSLDLKVTIKDMIFTPSVVSGRNSSINLMVNDMYFAGLNFLNMDDGTTNMVELEFTTIDSDTQLPVATSGVLPYNNALPTNFMSLNKGLISKVYGREKSVVLYKDEPGLDRVSFSTKTAKTPEIQGIAPEREVSVLYDNQATRTMRYETIVTGGYTMSPRSPIPVALPLPELKGNDYVKEPEMYYEITQTIPLEPVELAFKDFSFELPLESVIADVDLTKIEVETDRGDKLVYGTDFTAHSKKNGAKETVSIEILPAFRNFGAGNNVGLKFYGRTLTAKMPVELDDSQDLTPYLSADKKLIRVPLTATTKIDDFYKPVTSNEAFAEMTNQGEMTISHVDQQGRKLIKDVEKTDILGTKWPETYIENGGYVKDKIKLNGQEVSTIEIKAFTNPYEVSFIDKRYDFSLKGTSSSDGTGATVAQEEEIAYQLKLASNAKQSFVTPTVNNYQTAVVTLEGTNLDVLENLSNTANLTLADGTVVATANYSPASKSYEFASFNQTISWNQDLYFDITSQVKADAEIGKKISMKAKVNYTFDSDALSFTGESQELLTEIVKAKLEFQSHPNQINYGNIVRTTFGGEKIYPIKTMGDDLIVRDERVVGNNNGWRVSATLENDFTTTVNGVDYTLPNILKYKEGSQLKDLAKGQKVMIYNKYTDGTKLTNISENWIKDQDGLVLQLFSGKAKSSDYTATVLWELEDAY